MFRAADEPDDGTDDRWGWGAWTSGAVEVSVVPGDHHSMLREPKVGALAHRLQA